jgi:hypothetical protein
MMRGIEMTNRLEDVKLKIILLWIVVMINAIFADIFSFMFPGVFEATQEMMLVFAIIIEIPIAMIILSWVLKDKANRLTNIIASAIYVTFVIFGRVEYLHYYFFATIEMGCMALIVWHAWKWPKQEG